MKKLLLKTFTAWMALAILMPLTAIAEDWSSSGNYSIGWYNKNQTEFTLTTAKELAGMAYLVNNGYADFLNKTIKLGADIDLSGLDWIPCNIFKGTFDGQGHTISGITMDITSDNNEENFGFWRTFESASIKNLTLEGNTLSVNITKEMGGQRIFPVGGGWLIKNKVWQFYT